MTSEPREGIACGGNWTVDLIKVIDYYPQENTLSFISAVSQGGGGCGHNVVISLARSTPACRFTPSAFSATMSTETT